MKLRLAGKMASIGQPDRWCNFLELPHSVPAFCTRFAILNAADVQIDSEFGSFSTLATLLPGEDARPARHRVVSVFHVEIIPAADLPSPFFFALPTLLAADWAVFHRRPLIGARRASLLPAGQHFCWISRVLDSAFVVTRGALSFLSMSKGSRC